MLILEGLKRQIEWLAFTADGKQLACTRDPERDYDDDGSTGIEFWDLSRGQRDRIIPHTPRARGFALHPDGKWAYADLPPNFRLVNLIAGGQPKRLGIVFGGKFPVAISPDGKYIVVSGYGHSTKQGEWLLCWKHSSAGRLKLAWERLRTGKDKIPYLMSFFPDGQQLACFESLYTSRARTHAIAIRDPVDGKVLQSCESPGIADNLVVSPDGSSLLVRYGGKFYLFDAADLSRKPKVVIDEPEPDWNHSAEFQGRSVAYHPQGWSVAVTNNTPTVRFYDPKSWRVAKKFNWKAGRLCSVAFSPDGTRAAAGSGDGRIVVWDVEP